jgi:predicted RNA-binding Zn-ribbon protein involved in translation (DUF1610 family)
MAEYIDRAAAVKVILRERKPTNSVAQNRMLSIIQRDLLTMCAADVAPVVHGRWIEDHDYIKCPKCGVMVKRDFTFFDFGDWNFCPNCGAMMEGGAENAVD